MDTTGESRSLAPIDGSKHVSLVYLGVSRQARLMDGLTAAAWAVVVFFISNGTSPSDVDYGFLAGARRLHETGSWAVCLDRPPGYPAILAGLYYIVPDPVKAALYLSWASLILTTCAVFGTMAAILDCSRKAALSVMVLVALPWYTLVFSRASYEGPTMAVLYGALYFLTRHLIAIRTGKPRWSFALSASCLGSLVYSFWYAGAFAAGGILCLVVFAAFAHRNGRLLSLLSAIVGIGILAMPVVRNYLVGHNLSGHVMGVTPGENIFTASVKASYFLCMSLFLPLHAIVYFWWETICAITLIAAAGVYCWAFRRNLAALQPVIAGALWCGAVIVGASVTRIDELSPRFFYPAVPAFVMCIGIAALSKKWLGSTDLHVMISTVTCGASWAFSSLFIYLALSSFNFGLLMPEVDWRALSPIAFYVTMAITFITLGATVLWHFTWKRGKCVGTQVHRTNVPPASVLSEALVIALVGMVLINTTRFALRPKRSDPIELSPATVTFVRDHLPAGAIIATNTQGYQLLAYIPTIQMFQLPFVNSLNGDYDLAYGNRRLETDADLRSYLASTKPDYLVFLTGRDAMDPLFEHNAYGKAVERIFRGDDTFVMQRFNLPDGVVLKMVHLNM